MSVQNINCAYALFGNGEKRNVPVSFIENFSPKNQTDFIRRKKYKIWSLGNKGPKDFLRNGYILLLGADENDINEQKKSKRVHVPSQKHLSFSSSSESEKKKKKQPVKRKLQFPSDDAKKHANEKIFKNRLELLKTRKLIRESDEDENSDETIESVDSMPTLPGFTVKRKNEEGSESRKRQRIVEETDEELSDSNVDSLDTINEVDGTPQRLRYSPSGGGGEIHDASNSNSKIHSTVRNTRRVETSDSTARNATPRNTRRIETPESTARNATPKNTRRVETPESTARNATPRNTRRMETPKSTARNATPRNTRRLETPKSTARNATPRHTRRTETPKSTARNATPRNTRRIETPESTARNATPKNTRRVETPESTARNATPRNTRRVETPESTARNATPRNTRRVETRNSTARNATRRNTRINVTNQNSHNTTEGLRREITIDNEVVHIGENVQTGLGTWEMINLKKDDSKFIKEMAMVIWTREGLQRKCLNPERANKHLAEENIREAVTPSKYQLLKDLLFDKLTKLGVRGYNRERRVNKVWRYLSQKIYYEHSVYKKSQIL